MITRIFISALFILTSFMAYANGIGTWRNYLAYSDVTEIEKGSGNIIFVLASKGLYSYNTNDKSIQTFDKVNALSDCTISHIKWNNYAKRLVIIYENENIDIMGINGNVVNVPDYFSKSMTEDKSVNDIYIYGKHALLSTGFGIVDINVENYEIANTYNIGINVDYCYVENNYMYAASKKDNAIYSCSINDNLLDKNNWQRTASYIAKKQEDKTELMDIVKTLCPDGPKSNSFGCLKFKHGRLYTCSDNATNRTKGNIQILENDEWTVYPDNMEELTGIPYLDLNSIAVDSKDKDHVAVSGRTGVYVFHNGILQNHYTEGNSPLVHAATVKDTDPNKLQYVMAQNVEFDKEGNLWVLNSISSENIILKMSPDKEWTTWKPQQLMQTSSYGLINLVGLFFDSRDLVWFVNDTFRTPSAHCFQPSTGATNSFKTFTNQDGTTATITYVRCVTEDRNGDMWIGTNMGPYLLEQSRISETDPFFTQVKVPRNDGTNYADYLLLGVDISCVAVDGGNRKWFGTYNNGVYVISDDNIQQLQHFTRENSKLLSNNIISIAIDDTSGKVFIATDQGLCSYMSDATKPAETMEKDNVYAYPNPVRPDYTGLITIVGLTANADVKIVTSNGALVAQGRSNGGTFTWNGNDLSGKRVASGIYMVETATETGEKGTVCKIAIVK